jgi:hypothetical protein
MSSSLQGLLDGGSDVPAVLADHGLFYGLLGQIQHLKKGPVKGDQILSDQSVSGFDVVIDTDLKQGADGIIGVKGQAITI